jgi:hypothetical protein
MNFEKSQLNGEKSNKDNSSRFKIYEKGVDELTVQKEGLVLRGNRIVILDSLINTVFSIVKTKILIRTIVWFPLFD